MDNENNQAIEMLEDLIVKTFEVIETINRNVVSKTDGTGAAIYGSIVLGQHSALEAVREVLIDQLALILAGKDIERPAELKDKLELNLISQMEIIAGMFDERSKQDNAPEPSIFEGFRS